MGVGTQFLVKQWQRVLTLKKSNILLDVCRKNLSKLLCLLQFLTIESKAGNSEEGAMWKEMEPVTDGPALKVEVPWFCDQL